MWDDLAAADERKGGVVRRIRPPETGPEEEMLPALLDFLRSTVVHKVDELSDDQAFSRPVPPSALSPAGVVKHLAGTERFWFSIDFAAADVAWPWTDDDPHGDFEVLPGETLAGIVAGYQAECDRSRRVIAGAAPDDMAQGAGMDFNLRYAVAHMIEETARHCGHLDLLRERLDGAVGQ